MQARFNDEIIVIGATGLVGSHVLLQLLLQNKSVTATSRSGKPTELLLNLLEWYQIPNDIFQKLVTWKALDVTDVYSLEDVITSKAVVFHCAGKVSFLEADKKELEKINVDGTTNVVDVCLQSSITKLIYVSSVSTLSAKENSRILNEESYWKTSGNESNYARSKYKAEMEVWRGIEEGLNAVIVNPSIIIGPHDFTQGSVQLIEAVANGLVFYPSGATGFVDADDLAKVLIMLAESNVCQDRFIVNGANLSYKHFMSTVAISLKQKAPAMRVTKWMASIAWRLDALRVFVTKRKPFVTRETAFASAQSVEYDSSKLKSFLKFQFMSADDMIGNVCSFYLKQKNT